MRKLFTLLLFISVGITSWSQEVAFRISEIFPIEAEHSYVGFSIQYMGYAKVRGRFSRFNGSVRYNAKDPGKTSISLLIDVKSLDTDNEWRDKDLLSPNWFGSEAFPTIEFVSQKAELKSDALVVTGTLTMHGVTKTVVVPLSQHTGVVKDIRSDSQVIFGGEFSLNRKEYGVEGKNWDGVKEGVTAISDNVTIEITILGKQINEGNFRNWLRNPASPQYKIYNETKQNGVAGGIKLFESLRSEPNNKLSAEALNTAAYMLMKEGKSNDAVALAAKNIEAFPEDPNAYDSYAEALANAERWPEAKKYYTMALEMNPKNMNAKEVLRHIK